MADESVSEEEDLRLKAFLLWCKENNLVLNDKVKVCKKGSCHRYGMVATQDIQQNECLFSIPRNLLLEPKTCSIADIIKDLNKELLGISGRGSGWIPLLISLMYEFTNSTSFWRPYLDIVPSLQILDQPMFWGKEDRKRLLKDTEIVEDVEQDLKCIEKEYQKVVNLFIKKNTEKFSTGTHTMDLYKHMAAFVMAYSFTENSPSCHGDNAPVMVPMADILNHHSNNNAHLEFAKEALRMVSTQSIAKGEEVFNTYGQLANCHLLQSYGFVEQTPNPNDTMEIPIAMFYEVLRQQVSSKHEARILGAKFQFMEEMGLVSGDDGFIFDLKGCETRGPDLTLFMKFLHLTEPELHILLNHEDRDLPSDLADLISHIEQRTDEIKTSSCDTLAKVLKSKDRKRTSNILVVEELQRNNESPAKKLKLEHEDFNRENNELNGCQNTGNSIEGEGAVDEDSNGEEIDRRKRIRYDDERHDSEDDDDDDDENEGDDDDDENNDSENDVDCIEDDTNDDSDDGDDDDSDDGDDDDDEDGAVAGTEEEEQTVHVTYDQMSEFPLKWRQTLSRTWDTCGNVGVRLVLEGLGIPVVLLVSASSLKDLGYL
ncbi:hypothetical protein QZH41_015617, partial [Actinostola sp. cb2023]